MRLLFTLDYEIHGNGDGNPLALMVEPTYRLMTLLEEYHQHLIIMADVAEILCFRRYWQETGRDDFHVQEIETQLQDALRRGHDVQLHIHSSYFRAKWDGKRFDQCIEDYNMAALPFERIDTMVGECVGYLEELLRPVRADYKVWLFRAANWSMHPTPNIYRALVKHGITHDTSVYKGGCQGGNVCYDYRLAHDNLLPYTASAEDINVFDPMGKITEMPIYTEMRPFYDFISPIRIFRMVRAKMHKHKHASGEVGELGSPQVLRSGVTDSSADTGTTKTTSITQTPLTTQTTSITQTTIDKADNRRLSLRSFFVKSPLKMDFNQLRSRQLIGMMQHIERRVGKEADVPVVLIGHSKTFIPYNEKTLRPFLEWVNNL